VTLQVMTVLKTNCIFEQKNVVP